MNPDIIFFQSLICPRCVRVRRILNKIQNDHPNLNFENVGSITKFLRREVKTLPAIKIGETIFYGKEITENRILEELGLL